MRRLLIIDDEPGLLESLDQYFSAKGFAVGLAESGEKAIGLLQDRDFDVVVTDVAMPGMDGMAVLQWLRYNRPETPCIIITGVGTIEHAVEAIKAGAFHYLSKPFGPADLERQVELAIEHARFSKGLEAAAPDELDEIIVGEHPSILKLMQIIERVADSTASVMITGETGTGKSILAKCIHERSSRRNGHFLTIDCAALPTNLLESELFGHVKGAFTGATGNKTGLIEAGDGGTIFLDEVGELPTQTQSKLLRVIQEGVIRPIGSNTAKSVDVRFLSATSRKLREGILSGSFREDLYYRLAVVHLKAPALRERGSDILPLAQHFIRLFNARYNKQVEAIDPLAIIQLKSHAWKGNVRELKNAMERAVLLSQGKVLRSFDLSGYMEDLKDSPMEVPDSDTPPLKRFAQNASCEAVYHALSITRGNKTKAAKILGVSRQTIHSKIRDCQIDADQFK